MSGASLRRVNHDSSWLLTLPAAGLQGVEKSTFNLLIDPWLDDSSQIDYHPSFSEQKRTTPAVASSIEALERVLLQQEEGEEDKSSSNADDGRIPSSRQIDGILLSHPFTDHMHPPTLRDAIIAERKIPFLVTSDAKGALQSILGRQANKKEAQPRSQIVEIPQADHTRAPGFLLSAAAEEAQVEAEAESSRKKADPLPSNIHIYQLTPQERPSILAGPSAIAWGKLHGGVLILWTSPSPSPKKNYHSLLYTPHGIKSSSIPTWLQAKDSSSKGNKIHHEAILTSLDTITLPKWISGTVNLGLPAVIESIAQDVYPTKRILSTHDERKEARGMVASLLKRYWLGSDKLDSPSNNDAAALEALKQQDQHRQSQAQELVDAALAPINTTSTVFVLDPNETLTL